MKAIGFGIIGLGRQGLRLAEHIRNDIRHGKLIAVCRRSEAGRDYAEKHGVIFYSDYRGLLKNKDIDAVIITTPNSLHGLHAIEALKSKKHILIDKPIASTLKEGRKILFLAQKNKLKVAINFPLRVNPVTKMLKSSLPRIGKLRIIQVFVSHGPIRNKWQSNPKLSKGGVILDLGSHYFDLIAFLTGCRPGIISSAFSEKSENENSGFINLTCKDVNVSIILLRNQKLKKSTISCAGNKGSVTADYISEKVIISNNQDIDEINCRADNDFKAVLVNLVRSINKKEKIVAPPEAGIYSLKTALSVYKSINSRKPVKV